MSLDALLTRLGGRNSVSGKVFRSIFSEVEWNELHVVDEALFRRISMSWLFWCQISTSRCAELL